ncbi:PKD domain-containing protein [Marinicellulosiphila megalodicopiae]|uniref:PKD domain-containing protein n=1 Tax=Marinicellulosiphila megalodicopiae TaxID=2724896 RepID=UPI003BAF2502
MNFKALCAASSIAIFAGVGCVDPESTSNNTNTEDNAAPVVSFNTTTAVNNTVTLNPTVFDADGDSLIYVWNFKDGSPTSSSATSFEHKFPELNEDATYEVELTVYDSKGEFKSKIVNVFVPAVTSSENRTPTLDPVVQISSTGSATFTANAADADGDQLTYFWDFKDGNDSSLENPIHDYVLGDSIVVHNVELSVTDTDNNKATKMVEVTVPAKQVGVNYPPVANPSFQIGVKTIDTVSVDFMANASDPESDGITYYWDFKDGGDSTLENPTHIFSLTQPSQTFLVELTADDSINQPTIKTISVLVELNVAPVVSVNSSYTVTAGQSFTVSGTATDADDANLSYSWLINDEAFNSETATTTIVNEGVYTATFTVKDSINTIETPVMITVEAAVTTGDESYSLIALPAGAQHKLYAINTCGLNPVIDHDGYLLVDGSMSNINNDWSHVNSNATEWDGIAQSTADYVIDKGYTANANCNGAQSINNILVKKYTDWDSQHGNGFKFPVSNDNASFADLGTITMDIYIDSANSVLPTNTEVRSAYSGLTSAQLDEFDDGEFYLDIQLNYDGVDPIPGDDYATQGDVHGTINLTIDRDYHDQWLRVSVPVSSLIYREEVANWGVQTVSFNDVKDLVPSDMSFVAETKSRNTYRNYLTGTQQSDNNQFAALNLPKLYKEEAIRIKYLEISKSDGSVIVTPPKEVDYSLNDDKLYSSGEIYSEDLYLYGSIELRMKAAKGSGIVNGYFTYKNGSEVDPEPWEEIDMEVLGKNNAVDLQTNIITGKASERITSDALHTQVQSLADDFHLYRMDWYPDRVEFFLDGQFLSRAGKENMTVDQYASLTSLQGIRLNLWPANIAEWVGAIDDSVYPVSMELDYLSYSSLDQNTGNFVLQWTDDFNTLDTNRWSLANWTFGENDAKFSPNQVSASGGILKITLDHYRGE